MEENKITSEPNLNLDMKEIEINKRDDIYICQIQIIKDFLQVSLYSKNKLRHQGSIHISKIQSYLGIFDYNIEEIFEVIKTLNPDNFSLKKEIKECKLKIEFLILRKKKFIYIDLNDNISLTKNELIKTVSELKEIIKNKDNKIKLLEEELNKYKSIYKNNSSDNNFNIELKEETHKLNFHTGSILCSTKLKDERFATASVDKSIIIYNNKTFTPDITIKEHSANVNCILQLNSGLLISCSADNTIKLYKINGNEYIILQTLSYHTDGVTKVIELKNKKLVSCSLDKSIIFYSNDNNKYTKEYSISTNGANGPIIQTKDNEICFHELNNNNSVICFFDLLEKKVINKINKISISYYNDDSMLMISNDLLLITGKDTISILNVNSHSLVRSIDVSDSSWINAVLLLNINMILTADYNKRIIQWKIEGDNLRLVAKRENAHDNWIGTLSKIGNGHVLSGSADNFVKIW